MFETIDATMLSDVTGGSAWHRVFAAGATGAKRPTLMHATKLKPSLPKSPKPSLSGWDDIY